MSRGEKSHTLKFTNLGKGKMQGVWGKTVNGWMVNRGITVPLYYGRLLITR